MYVGCGIITLREEEEAEELSTDIQLQNISNEGRAVSLYDRRVQCHRTTCSLKLQEMKCNKRASSVWCFDLNDSSFVSHFQLFPPKFPLRCGIFMRQYQCVWSCPVW